MSQYKYELALELKQYLEDRLDQFGYDYSTKAFDAFYSFNTFTDPKAAWDFIRRADFFGTTLPTLLDRDEVPKNILEWASYLKSRDGYALIATSTTLGEAIVQLEEYIYGITHGEAA